MEVAHFVVGYHLAFYKCFCHVKAVSSLAVWSSCNIFRLHDVLFVFTTPSLSCVWIWC
jgi:hypothetical protein